MGWAGRAGPGWLAELGWLAGLGQKLVREIEDKLEREIEDKLERKSKDNVEQEIQRTLAILPTSQSSFQS